MSLDRLVLDTRRGRFEALTAGAVDAPPVLVLHGFPDAPPTFAPLARALAARGHRVIAPWLRGYHPSVATGPFGSDELAADVIAMLDELSPARPARVIGHDWGAVATYLACARAADRVAAAVTLAVPHPRRFLRALADPRQLAASWYMLFFQLPGAPTVARARDLALVDRLWRAWSPSLTLAPADRAAVHACLAASWPAPLAYYRAMAAELATAIGRRALPPSLVQPITVPTLYLHGADDGCIRVDSAAGAERCFAGPYRHQVLAGAGHFLAAERPALVAELADAWFRTHPGMERAPEASSR